MSQELRQLETAYRAGHGNNSRSLTLGKFSSSLEGKGVEFLPADDAHGAGVRLRLPKK